MAAVDSRKTTGAKQPSYVATSQNGHLWTNVTDVRMIILTVLLTIWRGLWLLLSDYVARFQPLTANEPVGQYIMLQLIFIWKFKNTKDKRIFGEREGGRGESGKTASYSHTIYSPTVWTSFVCNIYIYIYVRVTLIFSFVYELEDSGTWI